MEQVYDYIIVGAGTAGCLLANRLTADPTVQVLLIEAGGKDNYPWIHIPVGYLYCIDNPRTDWRYRTEPETGLNGRSLLYPRGRTLGGCSSINGMIYMRGQARDYDNWASMTGLNEWSWDACLRDFLAHEDSYRAADDPSEVHANGGEWRVERQRLRWDILDAYAEAAHQAGIPKTADFNTGDNEGVGYFDVNQRRGWRWSASKAFLRPVANRRNLTIWTKRTVDRLSFSEDGTNRCTGVILGREDAGVEIKASQEVILSSGAVNSPAILMRSGIGDTAELHALGVDTRRHLPGVGGNLQDHLQLRTILRVSGVRTLNQTANSVVGRTLIGLEYALWRSGPMSMAPSQLGVFTRSSSDFAYPNIQFHVQPLSLDAFGEPLHREPGITASVCNLNPTSRGHVRLRSRDPNDAPLIAPNYLSTEQDLRVAADSIRVARRIAEQPALAGFAPKEIKPGCGDDEGDLMKAAGDIGTTIFHPVGTAKMGAPNDPLSVVDPKLRVYGVENLRVVDASVMPTITSGNTNSPTLMIAEKAARWIIDARTERMGTTGVGP